MLEKNDFLNSLGIDTENLNSNTINIDIDKCWNHIACDSFGNQILLLSETSELGKGVYFANHESLTTTEFPNWMVYKVSDSFSEFIDLLKPLL